MRGGLALTFLLAVATGCTSTPPVPLGAEPPPLASGYANAEPTGWQIGVCEEWWSSFDAPVLDRLVEQALADVRSWHSSTVSVVPMS